MGRRRRKSRPEKTLLRLKSVVQPCARYRRAAGCSTGSGSPATVGAASGVAGSDRVGIPDAVAVATDGTVAWLTVGAMSGDVAGAALALIAVELGESVGWAGPRVAAVPQPRKTRQPAAASANLP